MPVAYIQALKVTATNDCNYINTVVSYANPSAPFPLTGHLIFKNKRKSYYGSYNI